MVMPLPSSSFICVPILCNRPPLPASPLKIARLHGDLDLHLIHASLGPPESTSQTTRSLQPFCRHLCAGSLTAVTMQTYLCIIFIQCSYFTEIVWKNNSIIHNEQLLAEQTFTQKKVSHYDLYCIWSKQSELQYNAAEKYSLSLRPWFHVKIKLF